MKYLFLLITLILTGCSQKNIKISNIQNINYKDIIILDNYHEDIEKIINQKYKKTDTIPNNSELLTITTKDDIHNFYITNDKIFYKTDKNNYYIKNNSLFQLLENIYTNYTNLDFFSITYNDIFSYDDNKHNIKLDNTNKNYEIITEETIYNFKINQIENEEIIDLLYEKAEIGSTTINIRTETDIIISFETINKFIITIKKNGDDFDINTKQKK